MKILFFSHFFYPHIGGVEKHVYLLSKELIKKGHSVVVVTEKYDSQLKQKETINGIKIIRFNYPRKRYVGLFYIWLFIWKNRVLLIDSDVIHIHDVFVWYFPFKFIFPFHKVFVTVHGLEWGDPFSKKAILQKKLAIKLSNGTIGVGNFLCKYLNVKFDLLIYGATEIFKSTNKKRNSIVFVGRLSKDTGVLKFLEWLRFNRNFKVEFVGDGELKEECERFGIVKGFTDPKKYIRKAEWCVPGGYLACLEAMSARCKVKVFFNDQLKKDYWQMSPMYEFIKNEDIDGAFKWIKNHSWNDMTTLYLDLWNK
jgi:glycosyltransferase involved in cell wall biosynthesis